MVQVEKMRPAPEVSLSPTQSPTDLRVLAVGGIWSWTCGPFSSPPLSTKAIASLQVPPKRPPAGASAAYGLVPILQRWKYVLRIDTYLQPAGCGLPGLRRDTAALAANAVSILESLIHHRTLHAPANVESPANLSRLRRVYPVDEGPSRVSRPLQLLKKFPTEPARRDAPGTHKQKTPPADSASLQATTTVYEYGPIGTLVRIPCHTADAVSAAAAAGHELHLVFLASCARCLTRWPANPDNQAPISHFHPMFHSPRLAACGFARAR
ncbi:uncharacterized protein CCOS01_11542 [Colletotrichum costaricense]|uniref:Uncharacterized protein n=1 Tax=Colletotrichum costaricense TaxID=1209916 RepID=A0AAI9YPZ1_9PEZI|nr:uncharacterized protein CCOS01_11542 [Colletotrichum costaricense]KAK1518722.1 hypothetical protein CCOS01_11542 [Colletotrichum costaricense]